MNKFVFKTLYVFSSIDKTAKVVEFVEGKNIITSNPIDGTDRGKSVLMKSLYHSMGADCFFDAKWDDDEKTYIVNFNIAEKEYYIYRCNRLFKLFDADHNLIFKTIERRKLAELLRPIFNFAVELPKKDEETLEITPPAYNYILYFLDQDKLSGPNFASFDRLAQYSNYKENVLFYHFGAFDKNYYDIIKKLEKVQEDISASSKRKDLIESMLDKVFKDIKEASYSQNIDLLRTEVNKSKEQYSEIAKNLSSIKNKLIQLRNEREDLLQNLHALKEMDKTNEKDIAALVSHKCPLCHSDISDTTELKVGKYNKSDDIIILSNDMQISVEEIGRMINKQETLYKEWLEKLNIYEEQLNIKSAEVTDVIKHKGYMEVKDSLMAEMGTVNDILSEDEAKEKALKKEERKYAEAKKKINERYYELMLSDKIRFGLEEINPKSFEKITSIYSAGGSNKPISTVIWYINLIKIKNEFNSDAINFPIVFDSPNNAETDMDKKVEVYKYLVDNVDDKNQLIVSGIGYNAIDFKDVKFDKIINLKNDKYHVLCSEDYENNVDLLREFCRS